MKIKYGVRKPFAFEAVVKTHGFFQLIPFYWEEDRKILNWAVKLDDGLPVLVKIMENSGGNSKTVTGIDLTVSRDLDEDSKEVLLSKFRHVFNLDLDLSEFYAICEEYPILDRVSGLGMGRIMRNESVFEDVFKSICGTNVQWKQAVKMINIAGQLGEKVPGEEFHVFPGPEKVLEAGEEYLKNVCRAGYRSGSLIDLCERFGNGQKEAGPALMLPDELFEYFLGFKGIGKVTAKYLQALYGCFDGLAIDSLVISYMTRKHFNGKKPTEKQIDQFYDKFGKWKFLAYWMEFIISGGWTPEKKPKKKKETKNADKRDSGKK